ncbi:MAG: 30S ribosomal protein S4e [Candidatus Aenigmarchaeota archaeon]|nr:30S ribosomal protein S4e [Candidatus Aenigmarchaeota archaeon]
MHLKRYSIPSYWKVPKKGKEEFITRPSPGPHPISRCIPLLVIVRNVLGLADNAKEASKIIKSGSIIVDKRERKDPNFPVGLMDVIEIPAMKKAYRVTVNSKGLVLEETNETDQKLCRINKKVIIKGGKIQLNLHDGRNITIDKGNYRTNDSIIIKLPEQKILKHIKFEKGSGCMIVSGKNPGAKGKIKEIFEKKSMLGTNRIVVQTKDKDIETVKDYILIGDFK